MNKLKKLFAVLLMPVIISVHGCALLQLPLALLALPLMLINGLFSLIGPALNAAPTLAPFALLLVKKEEPGASAIVPKQVIVMQDKPVDKIVREGIDSDTGVESVIFMTLIGENDRARLDETLKVMASRGYSVTCVISRKREGSVNQTKIDEVSKIMKKKNIKFYHARS